MDSKYRKFAIISVDTNDADYETHTIEVSEEQAFVLARVANAINTFEPYEVQTHGLMVKHEHNFPTGECLRMELGEIPPAEYYVESEKINSEDYYGFLDMIPSCEYGFHTVKEIKILAVIGEIKLI
jgi:hypothetical protein